MERALGRWVQQLDDHFSLFLERNPASTRVRKRAGGGGRGGPGGGGGAGRGADCTITAGKVAARPFLCDDVRHKGAHSFVEELPHTQQQFFAIAAADIHSGYSTA